MPLMVRCTLLSGQVCPCSFLFPTLRLAIAQLFPLPFFLLEDNPPPLALITNNPRPTKYTFLLNPPQYVED